MKVLSRVAMVLVLLGGLAYGSYAFGKYVLSARLFGTTVGSASGNQAERIAGSARLSPSVTRRIDIKGGTPRVEVQVLPAQEAGVGPEPPSVTALERVTSEKNYVPLRPLPDASSGSSDTRVGRRRFDNAAVESSESSSGRRERFSDRDNSDEDRPRRRRRRRRRSETTTERTTTARRERRRNRDDSPVPRSEGSSSSRHSDSGGSSGGEVESPIPVPE